MNSRDANNVAPRFKEESVARLSSLTSLLWKRDLNLPVLYPLISIALYSLWIHFITDANIQFNAAVVSAFEFCQGY